jgi:SHS2 domain-containing protein
VDKTFEVIDHTADIGIIAYGADIKQLFSNAAFGMFSLIIDPRGTDEPVQRSVELKSPDAEALLVEWLNELLFLFNNKHLVFNTFEFNTLEKGKLEAKCFGYKIKLSRNKLLREVKAATYYMLDIRKNSDGYEAQIIFDI